MIKYDPEKNAIVQTTEFSWSGTILPCIKQAQEWYKERCDNDELSEEERADLNHIEKFINWDPEKEDTPLCGTKADLFKDLELGMGQDEWDYSNDVELSLIENLIAWLSTEFGFDLSNDSIKKLDIC